MKRLFLFLLLISLPILSFAKYCPTCLQTFQVQTIRGQSQLLYRWLMTARDPKNSLKYDHFKQLFDKNVKIRINGDLMASGLPATYRYLLRLRQQQPLKEYRLMNLLVDGQNAALQYQIITQRKGRKYRSLVIAILDFKGHKLLTWSAVSHTTRLVS